MDDTKAYGAGMAGGQFDGKSFVRKPSVICRIGAALFGAAMWLAMNKGGWHRDLFNAHQQICLYNASSSTCSFVSAMGFFSLLAAIALLVADAQFDKISAVQTRSRVVRADLAISAAFALVFLLGFFGTASSYVKLELNEPYDGKWAKLAILFNLLACLSWGGAAFLAFRRHQAGTADAFAPADYGNGVQGISGDVADGYGYGGNDQGIGAVGGESYHAGGGPAQGMHMGVGQMGGGGGQMMGGGNMQIGGNIQQTNPFAGQPGYQY